MKPPPTLETTRLYLRQPTLQDATAIFNQYSQDLDVTKYLTWRPHENILQTVSYINRCLSVWEKETHFPWVMLSKESGTLMGMIEMRFEHGVGIGYVLAKAHWGLGYMPEAVRAVIDWAFQQESIYRVWAFCDVENYASARVLEKVGMMREGILQRWIVHPNIGDIPRDCYSYAIVKD